MALMPLRLYRRWKERRKSAGDRYAEMSGEQREAISRYQHRVGFANSGGLVFVDESAE